MLTDNELDDLYLPGRPDSRHAPAYIKAFARAIEAAVLAKLREQNEPVAWRQMSSKFHCWDYSDGREELRQDNPAFPLFEHPASIPEGFKQIADLAFDTLNKPASGYYEGLKLIMDTALAAARSGE